MKLTTVTVTEILELRIPPPDAIEANPIFGAISPTLKASPHVALLFTLIYENKCSFVQFILEPLYELYTQVSFLMAAVCMV
ncbi:uncharacterized protein EI90DRAFT_3077245, partial [Cantharellus anzutake]|uniref:uncharacterized protein n=1 Tax=Cantharellus anzutake TaxID=1750568 RepID=UPI0019084DA9